MPTLFDPLYFQHGPAMKKASAEKQAAWPKLTESEMADLMAALRR